MQLTAGIIAPSVLPVALASARREGAPRAGVGTLHLPPVSVNEHSPSLVLGLSVLPQQSWVAGTETHAASKALDICYLAIYGKSLLTSGLEQCLTPSR